jgi:hypothetical protein
MTEKPVLESPTAEVMTHFRAKEEAEQLQRVAASGFGGPHLQAQQNTERRNRLLR